LEIVRNLRRRYDGTRRNPYNEIECGDHYSRAMAGWSLLDALTGVRYDGLSRALSINPPARNEPFRAPVIFGDGWGTLDWQPDGSATLACVYGQFVFGEIAGTAAESVTIDGAPVTASSVDGALRFAEPAIVAAGSRLEIAG
jgi:hypothetical protein